jgi:hypothetical protein
MNDHKHLFALLRNKKMDEANAIVRDYPECIEKTRLYWCWVFNNGYIEIFEYYLNNGWEITYEYVDKIARHIVSNRHCSLTSRRLKYIHCVTHYLYMLLKKYNAPITDKTIMVMLNDMAYMLTNGKSNMILYENFIISLQEINTMFEQGVVDSVDLNDIKYIDVPYYGIDKKTYINVMLEKIPRSCASSICIFRKILCMRDEELLDKYLNICEQFNTKKDLYKQSPYLWCYENKLTSMFKRLILNEIPLNKVSFPPICIDDFYKSPGHKLMLKLAMSLGYKITEK